MVSPRVKQLSLAPVRVTVTPLPGGGMQLRSAQDLGPYPASLGRMLEHWGEQAPDRVFLAERSGAGWRRITYGAALGAVRNIGQALLDRGLSGAQPVAILSDNSIDHALLALGAMHVGVPVAPISPAYSLVSRDYSRLRYALELLNPGLIFAADGAAYTPALLNAGLGAAELVVSANPPSQMPSTAFDELLATRPSAAVDESLGRVGPDTVGKILFSSGSTGLPKGVINTQRMMCSNQQALAQVWTFLAERPPLIMDWLPWHHTFGGNFCFNMMLRHGGTIYIDDGKPTPQRIARTAANLREISPTLYFNVPRGFDMVLPFLEKDEALRLNFFRELDLIFYAAAALPQNLWSRLQDIMVDATGRRIMLASAWGATETAPMVTVVHYPIDRAGAIGVPAPGCELKMVPHAGKLEMRVRGPNVTPGYWQRDDLTRQAFDEEGYYCIGDAGRLVDPDEPGRGLECDGRLAEDFKLMTGTWVSVGNVRLKAIAAGKPLVQDAVITGHDREEVGLLLIPSEAGCRSLCPDAGPEAPLSVLATDPRVRAHIQDMLRRMAAASTGSSDRPTRALILAEPLSIDANEITDKGYINQNAVLTQRAELVDRLYASESATDVILLDQDVACAQ